MKQMDKIGLLLAILGLALIFFAQPTTAALVGWHASVNYDDGGTATGSFVFDNINSAFSSVSINTTEGTLWGARTFDTVIGGNNQTFVQTVASSDGPDFFGSPTLFLGFQPNLLIDNSSINSSSIYRCEDNACITFNIVLSESSRMTSASLTPSVVPIPAAAWLLASVLCGLFGIKHVGRRGIVVREGFNKWVNSTLTGLSASGWSDKIYLLI